MIFFTTSLKSSMKIYASEVLNLCQAIKAYIVASVTFFFKYMSL